MAESPGMRWLVGIVLALWIAACVVGGALLLLHHMAPLPIPPRTDRGLRDALAALPGGAGRWRAVHIMYRSCTCSRRTIDHLLAGPRPAGLDERVIMVDDDGLPGHEDQALRDRGFTVEVITPAALHARFDVEAAPLFVIARPDHELAYVGGYNRSKQSPAYEDLAILAEVKGRGLPAPLPVFGCATSARLADELDPLRLRRW